MREKTKDVVSYSLPIGLLKEFNAYADKNNKARSKLMEELMVNFMKKVKAKKASKR